MKELLRRNLGLKLLSLLIAYLAWTVVVGRPAVVTVSRIPVRIKPGPTMVVVATEPKLLTVEISGSQDALKPEQILRINAELDVSDLPLGEQQIPVARSDLKNLPAGVGIDIIDSIVAVTLEERATKLVPVSVGVAGSLPEGFTVVGDNIRARPDKVMAVGARSRVEQIDSVSTEAVDLTGQTGSFERTVKLLLPVGHVFFDPPTVDVLVDVDRAPASADVELEIRDVPQGWRVSPVRVRVTLRAPPDVLPVARRAASASLALGRVPEARTEAEVVVGFPELDERTRSRITVDAIVPRTVTIERAGQGL